MKKTPLIAVSLMLLMGASGAAAQRVDTLQLVEPGDKFSFNWTFMGKSEVMEETYNTVSEQELAGLQKVGDKSIEVVVALPPFLLTRAMCLNGQRCSFTPGLRILELPLEKGKKWTTKTTVAGETFTSEITQERKIEKVEKVRVPAGEFEAFKIAFNGTTTGRTATGTAFSGREEGTDWVAIVGGKAVFVKTVYRNSFGEKASREMISTSLK